MRAFAFFLVRIIYFIPLLCLALVEVFVAPFFSSMQVVNWPLVKIIFWPYEWADRHWGGGAPKIASEESYPDAMLCTECSDIIDPLQTNYGTPEYPCCIHCFNDAQECK